VTDNVEKFEEEPECPKCLSKEMEYRYITKKKEEGGRLVHVEYLHVTCKTCDYGWNMEVAPGGKHGST